VAEKRANKKVAQQEEWRRKKAEHAEATRRVVIGGFLAILGFIVVACSSGNDPAAEQLAQRVIGNLGSGTGWDHVEIETAQQNEYVLKLVYHEPPSDSSTVWQDTRRIALAVLSELVATGRHPSSDHTFLWVWAQCPAGRGETGAELVQVYGHMEYDYDTDQLEFKPWNP
jgi:hypothetical protein